MEVIYAESSSRPHEFPIYPRPKPLVAGSVLGKVSSCSLSSCYSWGSSRHSDRQVQRSRPGMATAGSASSTGGRATEFGDFGRQRRVTIAHRAYRSGSRSFNGKLAGSIGLGLVFLAFQGVEWVALSAMV